MLYDCDRCGRTCLSESAVEKAKLRGKTPLCRDCQTRRLFRVQFATDYCVPHQGFFDSEQWPVNNNNQRIYLDQPTCGYQDCIRAAHHTEPAEVIFVQPRHVSPRRKKGYKMKSGQAA